MLFRIPYLLHILLALTLMDPGNEKEHNSWVHEALQYGQWRWIKRIQKLIK